jgi:hypothetical protein
MAAGITDKLWLVEDIVALVEASERGPYTKRIAALLGWAYIAVS